MSRDVRLGADGPRALRRHAVAVRTLRASSICRIARGAVRSRGMSAGGFSASARWHAREVPRSRPRISHARYVNNLPIIAELLIVGAFTESLFRFTQGPLGQAPSAATLVLVVLTGSAGLTLGIKYFGISSVGPVSSMVVPWNIMRVGIQVMMPVTFFLNTNWMVCSWVWPSLSAGCLGKLRRVAVSRLQVQCASVDSVPDAAAARCAGCLPAHRRALSALKAQCIHTAALRGTVSRTPAEVPGGVDPPVRGMPVHAAIVSLLRATVCFALPGVRVDVGRVLGRGGVSPLGAG